MCARITVLTREEVAAVVADIQAGRKPGALVRASGESSRGQAYPGSSVDALALQAGEVCVSPCIWGFEVPWGKKPVFNTRLESALEGKGMWRSPIRDGRCILLASSFFEPHMSETIVNPKTRRAVKRSYEFWMADGTPLMLASVQQEGRLSVVTTVPNSYVKDVHPRMPLGLRFEEVPLWLEGDVADLAQLADRAPLSLDRAAVQLARSVAGGAQSGGAAALDDGQLTLF